MNHFEQSKNCPGPAPGPGQFFDCCRWKLAQPGLLSFQSVIKPRRSPRLTASVRLDAPSLLEIDEIWNFTVWSLICSLRAMSLFDRPWLTSSSTSRSRVVKDSSRSE